MPACCGFGHGWMITAIPTTDAASCLGKWRQMFDSRLSLLPLTGQGTSDHLWGDSLLKELDLVAALVVNLLMITLMLLDLYGIIDFGAFH